MNNTRRKWLRNRLDASAEPIWAEIQRLGDGQTQKVCMGVVDGSKFLADSAVSGVKPLEKLWGTRGDDNKARRLLEEFSFEMLSMWLWKRSSLASIEGADRDQCLELLLTAFEDRTQDAIERFVRRDVQRRYELTTDPPTGGQHIVGAMLLLSDAAEALGGDPSFRPVPADGYPFPDVVHFLQELGPQPKTDEFSVGEHLLISVAIFDAATKMFRGLGMSA